MKVARYIGGGQIAIEEDPVPTCPTGGLLVQTEACGLCSGELMAWYMDKKIPHVLGHEVVGKVIESQDIRFPVGSRVFPHHHAPCLNCEHCQKGNYVHCLQWKRTKLIPGGMAEFFAVGPENLNDTLDVGALASEDAALIEPLACVIKAIRRAGVRQRSLDRCAVIGLGVMGLMHMTVLGDRAVGFDLNQSRRDWATRQGFRIGSEDEAADTIFVCPGSQAAFDAAYRMIEPGGTIVMFAPLPPNQDLIVPNDAYFRDVNVVQSYSCGPDDTLEALEVIKTIAPWSERIVSDFVSLEELPESYQMMKDAKILKAMVRFR
ncbi:zinc-dependent dehydrogenase [soil metagenome]